MSGSGPKQTLAARDDTVGDVTRFPIRPWLLLVVIGGALALILPASNVYLHMQERRDWTRDCQLRLESDVEQLPRIVRFCEAVDDSITRQPNDLAYAIAHPQVRYPATIALVLWLCWAAFWAVSLAAFGWLYRLFRKAPA